MAFREWVVLAGQLMEGAGVGVMVLGAILSVALLMLRQRRRARGVYRQLRQDLGRAILLGLEFLIAADIIRTVSEKPTLPGVAQEANAESGPPAQVVGRHGVLSSRYGWPAPRRSSDKTSARVVGP